MLFRCKPTNLNHQERGRPGSIMTDKTLSN